MCICFALQGEHPPPLLAAHNPKVLDDLDCTPTLLRVLKRATAFDRGQRTATCLELVAALGDELDDRKRSGSGRARGRRRPTREIEPPSWTTSSGSDAYGPWAILHVESVMQRMRCIAPGTFWMGSPHGEPGRVDIEGPQHQVTITRGFWMADTPCTQALWEAVMGSNPSLFVSERRPVEQVSWDDLQKFLMRLETLVPNSSKWKQTQHPRARSGTRTTQLKRLNPWGLYDMLGNVWEWCEDGMRTYGPDPSHDPVGPTDHGTHRIRRGGSWLSDASRVRAAYRYACHPDFRYCDLGFRFICTGR